MSLALPHMQAILLTPRRVSSASATLLTDLISHWRLDEASGNGVDSHGTNTLVDVNTVTAAAGKLGTSRQFTAASTEWFSVADNASLSVGNIDYTFAAWVYMDSKPANFMYIVDKANSGGAANDEYSLYWDNTTDRFNFRQRGTGTIVVVANNLGAPALSTWYYIVGWHDAAADTLNIQVNGGTVDSITTSGTFPSDGAQSFAMGGRSGAGTLPWNGRIDSVSFWKRVLTSTERTALYNGGAGSDYPFAAPTYSVSLSDLISHWRLDEASGNGIDAHGTNTLTDTNTVTTAAGKIGTSRQFTATNSEQLAIANNATLDLSASGFTFAGWFYTDTVAAGFRMMISKDTASAPNRQFSFYLNGSQPNFEVFNAAGSSLGVPLSAVSASTWYFVVGWWDPADSKAYVSINNAAPSVSAGTAALNTSGAADFKLGYRNSTFYWDGRIDSVSLWKRVLTADERTALYAGASGLDYPFVTSSLLTDLISYWKLDEASGNALDAHGTNTLTDNNTVTSAAGKLGTARQFTVASSEYLSLASNATIETGDIDYTLAGWLYVDAIGTLQTVVSKNNGTSNSEYILLLLASGKLRFQIFDGVGGASGSVDSTETLLATTWYHWTAYHDAANNLVGVTVNAGTPTTAATTGPAGVNASRPFQIGARNAPDVFFGGRQDSVAFWKRMLTASERNALYNAGVGREYPFT
jgi:hypothetical protein